MTPLPKKLRELQDFTDRLINGSGTEPTGHSRREEQVAVPLALWPDLEWLEDGPLSEAVSAQVEDGYAEGEEEDPFYVFYVSGGLSLADLGTVVQVLLDGRARGRFSAAVVGDRVVVSRA